MKTEKQKAEKKTEKKKTAKHEAVISAPKKTHITVHASGKRKRAIARTTVSQGHGRFTINSQIFDSYGTSFSRLRLQEVIDIISKHLDISKLDISVSVSGGGTNGQIDAIRTSICKSFLLYAQGATRATLKEAFINHDRVLLAGDSRRTEPHKPSRSSQGPRAKRQKSYR